MKLADRIAAWWSAWQWVVILAAICIALAWLNVWQWKRAITASLRVENTALTQALDRINGMAEQRDRDDSNLFARLDAIADRGERVRIEYRRAAAAAPLASTCAPGQDRIDAVNRALGPITTEK